MKISDYWCIIYEGKTEDDLGSKIKKRLILLIILIKML
jgi:hypothetical protein